MHKKHMLWRFTLLTGLVVYTLSFAEVCVRLMDSQPLMPRYITGTAWGVRGNIPNATYRHKTQEVDVEYRINSQGMRADKSYSFQKPAQTCRVALFGDSFFMGYELALEDTFAAQLEKQLGSTGTKAEVINFAVSGFGTAEMMRTYTQYAVKFSPDLVIFQWHSTDPDDNIRSALYELKDEKVVRGQDKYLPSVALQDALMKWRLYRIIADNSHLYAWARERVATFVKRMLVTMSEAAVGKSAQASSTPANGQQLSPQETYSEKLSAELLREAKRETREAGSSFLVVDIPDPVTRTSFNSSWKLVPASLVADIPVLHAADVFQPLASPTTKLYFEKGHGHITPPAAHALAVAVAAQIERDGSCTTATTAP